MKKHPTSRAHAKKTTKIAHFKPVSKDFFHRLGEESWTYIKTVVDVVREPVMVLNKDFRVLAANEPFYRMFRVEPGDTENKVVYELGNNQWNISALKKLLEDILPKHTFFKGFEVDHKFPIIGRKVMLLNARQIHFTKDSTLKMVPPIILLAIEDITEIITAAETLANHAKQLEIELTDRTNKLELMVKKIERRVNSFKKE
jgi:two-component system CheB/CheR fusion protein